jgi:hypothetical protein
MFEMTYNQAKTIQDAQLVYYRQSIGRAGVKKIRSATFCPSDLDPNKMERVSFINTLVPRGGAFEHLETYRPKNTNDAYDWHNAIRNGKIYH